MTPDSFMYNGIDMYESFKIKVLAYDLLMPELRQRRVEIPGRSGSYDYGAKHHNDRPLRMSIEIQDTLSNADFDALKYTLSRKGRIIMWDKPDRYFYGQIYDMSEVIDYFQHAMREFEVNFLCDPYAYALEPTILRSTEPIIRPEYEGTREAPTRISITNNGDTPIENIRITARVVR